MRMTLQPTVLQKAFQSAGEIKKDLEGAFPLFKLFWATGKDFYEVSNYIGDPTALIGTKKIKFQKKRGYGVIEAEHILLYTKDMIRKIPYRKIKNVSLKEKMFWVKMYIKYGREKEVIYLRNPKEAKQFYNWIIYKMFATQNGR